MFELRYDILREVDVSVRKQLLKKRCADAL